MILSLFTLKVQYVLLAFLGVPISYLFNLHWKNEEPYRKTTVNTEEIFDFIIVGGGTAGLVVANRLSEHYNVLLLEAGGNPLPLTAAPGLAGALMRHPDVDWADKAVPQEHACHALKNNGALLNHGKGLGGSSMLNFMQYMRGSPEDYNEWARVTKDSEWSYKELLPFFRKMETYKGQFNHGKVHGTSGNVQIEIPKFVSLAYEWEQAAKELGYKIMDPNGFQEESFNPVELNSRNGSRDSTYTAYIEPILKRETLKIELYAHVTKIELDDQSRAVGVHYVKDGRKHFVKASKEIILSAGALGSPKILMLSGIGPAEHLKSLGIPVKLDLPVGQNLQDHVITHVGPFIIDPGTGFLADRDMNASAFSDYLEYNRGPLSTFGCAGSAVIESSLAEKGWPDILLVGATWGGLHANVINEYERTLDLRSEVLEKYYEGHIGNDSFIIAIALGRPTGRGELKLASEDPFEPPLVDPKYLHDSHDRQALLDGVKFGRRIAETKAFKSLGARLIPNLLPGCEQYGSADSDDYWKCYLKHWTSTMWHFPCTCRMGAKNDKNSVVDSKLRVHGTKGLRVIDNSIMPQVTNANTNIPAILIGEKGADIVLQKWKPKKNGQKS